MKPTILWAAAATLLVAAPAKAEQPSPATAERQPLPLIVLKGDLAPPAPSIVPADEAAIPIADLDDLRGGQTMVVSNQTMTAVTSGNVLNGDYTAGAVSFSDNAFSSYSGIGNLAINTGAQVSLQSGMSIVINVER